MRNKKILAVLLALHLFLLLGLKFTAWPEMTLWPYLITKGWLPYRDIAIAHTPLMLVDLTIVYKIFGVGIWQLKIYTWLLILLTDGLFYWIASKIWNKKTAIISLLFFIPLQLYYEGNGLWFDLALVPIALLIFHFLNKKDYLLAGIFWVLAFFTKQTAFWFLIPIGFTLLQDFSFKKLKKVVQGKMEFVIGATATFAVLMFLSWILGFYKDFLYWAFQFGIGVLPRAQGQINLPSLRQSAISLFPFSILLVLPFIKKKKELFQLAFWSLAGLMGAFPRWELFHFQPALPFLAFLGGLAITQIKKDQMILKIIVASYLFANLFLVSNFAIKEWGGGTRFFEPEVNRLAAYVKEKVEIDEKIYILNAWDSVYAWSNTLPAERPWVPHLAWYMELPGIQEDIVQSLDIVRPKLILQGEYAEVGLGAYKPTLVDDFIQENYELSDNIGNYLFWIPKE